MKINDVEFEFDMADEKYAEMYDLAIKNYNAKLPEVKNAEGVEVVKLGNQMVRDFFYEATGVDVMAGCTNLRTMFTCYKEFLEEVTSQIKTLHEVFPGEDTSRKSVPTYPVGYMGRRPNKN